MALHSKYVDGIGLFYELDDQDTADMIAAVIPNAAQLIHESWGLKLPPECSIYLMTSWQSFYFYSAPWSWWIFLAIGYPVWSPQARRMWPLSGAWTLRYGRKVTIGIKPPRLIEQSDKSLGARMYVKEDDMSVKLRHYTCHELTHACAARLRLPAWLNEGLAMLTVDRFLGKRTIRADTLEQLRLINLQASPPSYRRLSRMKPDAIAGYTLLGYWLVVYLEQVHADLLKRLFTYSLPPQKYVPQIAAELGIDPGTFWARIPALILEYFSHV